MKLITRIALFFLTFFFLSFSRVHASSVTYIQATVSEITKETQLTVDGTQGYIQDLRVREDQTLNVHDVEVGSQNLPLAATQRYIVGQHVVLVAEPFGNGFTYSIYDQYRIPQMVYLLIGFFVLVVIVARAKGILSIIGMVLSVCVLLFFMVPSIAHGGNPIEISIISSLIIGALMIYLSHGFGTKSHVAWWCVFVTLLAVAALSYVMIHIASLSGFGDETASYLQFAGGSKINLQGLYLGGIILASLSVLNDSVISQVSVVYQLKKVKHDIGIRELYMRGMEVGKDHISILVNTLILAYAGSSLPLFILFTQAQQPAWVSLNDQFIAEEIVRTLTGSIGLVLSIPLTTIIVAYVVTHPFRWKKK